MNDRRSVLKSLAGIAAFSGPALGQPKVTRNPGFRIQLALNAYSFNQPLRSGAMTLEDLVDYCARHGIDALDATGYYFPGYPKVPGDESIYRLKRRGFVNGVKIIGTGVRNDFAGPDAAARGGDVRLVKDWIDTAARLGASIIRVFAGATVHDATAFDRALEWMIPAFKECAAYGERRGVLVGLQNHNDFLKTAAETIRVVEAVNSEWFGVILDIGSLRQGDPYAEIEKLLPYAVSWQLKENVWYGKKETPTDLAKIRAIIEKGGYRGYVPIETLGEGDPRIKVARFLERVRTAFVTA